MPLSVVSMRLMLLSMLSNLVLMSLIDVANLSWSLVRRV